MLFMIGGIAMVLSSLGKYMWSHYFLKIMWWLKDNSIENYNKYNELSRKKDIKNFCRDFDDGLINLDEQTKKHLKTARVSLKMGKVVFIFGLILMILHFAV